MKKRQNNSPILFIIFLGVILAIDNDMFTSDGTLNFFELGILVAEIVCLGALLFLMVRNARK
jgi:hypothetical protein